MISDAIGVQASDSSRIVLLPCPEVIKRLIQLIAASTGTQCLTIFTVKLVLRPFAAQDAT